MSGKASARMGWLRTKLWGRKEERQAESGDRPPPSVAGHRRPAHPTESNLPPHGRNAWGFCDNPGETRNEQTGALAAGGDVRVTPELEPADERGSGRRMAPTNITLGLRFLHTVAGGEPGVAYCLKERPEVEGTQTVQRHLTGSRLHIRRLYQQRRPQKHVGRSTRTPRLWGYNMVRCVSRTRA